MHRFHVKKGDEVVIISGSERGRRGKVLEVLVKKQRVLVEGCNMVKRHLRKSQLNPTGKIVDREGSIHVSNVMAAAKYDERASKRSAPAGKQD